MNRDFINENRISENVETLYKNILDNTNSAIYVCDMNNYQMLYMNEQCKKYARGDVNNYLKTECYKVMMDLDNPCEFCKMKKMKKDRFFEREFSIRGKKVIHCRLKGRIIEWNGIKAHIEYISDETERVESEKKIEKLYTAEKERRRLLEEKVIATNVINVTKDQCVESIVKEGSGLLTIKNGCSIDKFNLLISEHIIREEQKAHMSMILNRDYLLNRFGGDNERIEFDYYIRIGNGISKWISTEITLIEHPRTGDVMAYCYTKDINNSKLRKIVLQSALGSETDFILWLNTVNMKSIKILDRDMDGTTYDYNEEDYYDMVRHRVNEYIADEDKERVRIKLDIDYIKEQLDKKDSFSIIYKFVSETGIVRHNKLRIYYVDREREQIVFVRTNVTDVYNTEQQQRERLEKAFNEAQRANQAKSDFLSKMSHEIRTPMNAIMGMTRLAKDETSIDKIKEYLIKMSASEEYLLGVLNDILDMSKIERDKIVLQPEIYNLSEFEKMISSVFVQQCLNKHIEFKFKIASDVEDYIYVDKLRFNQVFFNLLSNAVKYTNEYGRIELAIEKTGEDEDGIEQCYIVKDNGIGIGEEFIKHIFEPFSQENTGATAQLKGTGLGLAIAKNIVDSMGGKLMVSSKAGEGTTFTVVIKTKTIIEDRDNIKDNIMACQPLLNEGNKDIVSDIEGNLSGIRVLLAEDNLINCEIAKAMLEMKNAEVEVAENGQIAVDMFAKSSNMYYDVILMDIKMPVMDGLEATMEIRKMLRDDAKLPIFAITANAFDEDVEKSRIAGLDEHLSKPIELDILTDTIIRYVRR